MKDYIIVWEPSFMKIRNYEIETGEIGMRISNDERAFKRSLEYINMN